MTHAFAVRQFLRARASFFGLLVARKPEVG